MSTKEMEIARAIWPQHMRMEHARIEIARSQARKYLLSRGITDVKPLLKHKAV